MRIEVINPDGSVTVMTTCTFCETEHANYTYCPAPADDSRTGESW